MVCRYDVMRRCWNIHAWRRPNFDQLVTETSNIIAAMTHSSRHSSARSSAVVCADRDGPADVDRPSVSAPDDSPMADYLQPTPRCSGGSRHDDEPSQPNHASDGDPAYVHRRQPPPPPPSINYDQPTSSTGHQDRLPSIASPRPDSEQLPWRCTAV